MSPPRSAKLDGTPAVPVSSEEYRITVLRRTLAKRNRDIDPADPVCRRCRGTGWLWKYGSPRPPEGYYGAVTVVARRWARSNAKRPLTVRETKSLQVHCPGEGRLEGSQVSWDRIAENCQCPTRCPVCGGTGELSADDILRLSGSAIRKSKKRQATKKSVSTEELAALLQLPTGLPSNK